MFKKREMGQAIAPKEATINKGGENEKAQLIAQWQRDAEELKHLVPDFDLDEAVKNEAFYEALAEGKTVFYAYKLASERETAPAPRREIMQNAQHARRGTGGSIVNPARMSREDFKKYIDNIRNS